MGDSLRHRGQALAEGSSVKAKRRRGRPVTLTPAVLTKDFEVNGRILLSGLVLGDADVLGLVVLIHLPDGQLRAVVTEQVLLAFLVVYLLSVPAEGETPSTHGSDHTGKMQLNAVSARGKGSVFTDT